MPCACMSVKFAKQHAACCFGCVPQVIYGYQKLATCSMDSTDLPPNSNCLGVMITLRMRLHCAIVRAGQEQPEQVGQQHKSSRQAGRPR